MTAVSLTSHLTRWPDHRLHRLFLLRPDLCHPPVPDVAALAARASTQMSVLRALDGLDRAHLDVLEALAALPAAARIHGISGTAPARRIPDAGPVTTRDRLADFFNARGPGDSGASAVDQVLDDLAEAALALPVGDGWVLPLAVAAALGPHPLGLGRSQTVLVPDDDLASSSKRPADSSECPTGSDGVPTAERSTDRVRLSSARVPTDRAGVLAALCSRTEDQELLTRATAALDALQSSPVARLPDPPGSVHDLLLDAGLLVRTGRLPDGTALAEHPLEAGLAWRDGTAGRRLDPAPPPPTNRTVPSALSSNAALAAITDLLRGCADLLGALADGVSTLRSGGVGVREVKRLADSTGSMPDDTAWLLELLAATGLVVLDPDTSRWVLAPEAADWLRSGRQLQWEALVLGWLGNGRAPMLGPVPAVGASPASSRSPVGSAPVPSPTGSPSGAASPPSGGGRALAPDRNRPDAPRLRATVLETALELAEERPGTHLDEDVARRLHWRSPRQSSRTATFTAPLLAEAARLGLTGAGALTTAGALVADDRLDEAADAVGAALPAPLTHVRLQGDLTAVAPGYLDPEVARTLASMADVEGDGAARVYRFSDDSLHRALDAGLDASVIEEFLDAHSEDELPQSLRYLIRDVARRHGALTVAAAGSWLRVEDEALLDAIIADPALVDAGLEHVAPTVLVATVSERELHRMLADAGHRASRRRRTPDSAGVVAAPGASSGTSTTSGTGAADVVPSSIRRAMPGAGTVGSAVPAPVRAVRWTPSEEELAAQVARLRAAPRTAPTGSGTEEAVVVLRHAARQRTEVDLVTVDQSGHRQSLRVVPLAVAGGRVRCLIPSREAETVVPLHRVVSAAPAETADTVEPAETAGVRR